jgi:hypothetical protein
MRGVLVFFYVDFLVFFIEKLLAYAMSYNDQTCPFVLSLKMSLRHLPPGVESDS